MRIWILFLILINIPIDVISGEKIKYWVFLQDKADEYSIDYPEAFLSEAALKRRSIQDIDIHYSDLPVSSSYLGILKKYGKVCNISRWFNAVSILVNDSVAVKIGQLPFVMNVSKVKTYKSKPFQPFPSPQTKVVPLLEDFYGEAFDQIEMVKGNYLHQKKLSGSGMIIGVMDSGFKNVDENRAFRELFTEGRILGTRDFVDEQSNIYEENNHGANVFSIMAADLPGEMVGTAPDASYYLFRTENSSLESLMEEDNWVAAAEAADQLGVHIISTSLGYSTFQDTSENHTYADMDGNTTLISRAADMAAKKGMLPVTSAGNEGNSPWFFITAPADGDSVMAVGAVNESEVIAGFSGRGPSSDGDVKPNICAMGVSTAYVNTDGQVRRGNGTSYSAPIISGLAACLWQAFPEKSNMDVFRSIEQSASYVNPNDECGFGIPDFEMAFNILANNFIEILGEDESSLIIAPNPFSSGTRIFYKSSNEGVHLINIYDLNGRRVFTTEMYLYKQQYNRINLDVENLSQGQYMVRIIQNDLIIDHILVKTPH